MLLKGWQLQHRNFKVQRIAHKTSKVKKLKAPFIKVEDRSHKYKVDFVEMQTVPFLDLDSEGTKSPFETWYLENVPKRSQKNVYQQQPANYAKEPIMILTVIWFLQDTQQQQTMNHVLKALID